MCVKVARYCPLKGIQPCEEIIRKRCLVRYSMECQASSCYFFFFFCHSSRERETSFNSVCRPHLYVKSPERIGLLLQISALLVCVCVCVCVCVRACTQSCLTLCDSMDCFPPGSSVHGIFQVRILECLNQMNVFLECISQMYVVRPFSSSGFAGIRRLLTLPSSPREACCHTEQTLGVLEERMAEHSSESGD